MSTAASAMRLFSLCCFAVAAQENTLLDQGYRQMYDLDFPEAHKTFAQWMKLHPEDPLGPVSDAAAYLFTEFDRLHILQGEFFLHDENFRTKERLKPDPVLAAAFQKQLARCEQLAALALAKNPRDTNALFAEVLRLGLKSDYDGLIDKRYIYSLSTTKLGRNTAEKLLAIDPTFYDAWIAIGVENYLLSLKPMPIRWILQLGGNKTDRNIGVEKLKLTAEKGRYLRPFARLLMAVVSLRESDFPRAKQLLKGLRDEFPHNPLYASELARIP